MLVSSEEAPKYIEGMKSMNVCVIARLTINIMSVVGENVVIGRLRSAAVIRFICIPGVRPVTVPARIPKKNEIAFSNIHSRDVFSFCCLYRLWDNYWKGFAIFLALIVYIYVQYH